jgi:hypothetical protein
MANLSGEEGKRHILGVVSSFAKRMEQNHLKDYEFDIDVYSPIGMWRVYQHPTPAQLIDILPRLSLGYTISEIISTSVGLEIVIMPSNDFSTNIDADVIDAIVKRIGGGGNGI